MNLGAKHLTRLGLTAPASSPNTRRSPSPPRPTPALPEPPCPVPPHSNLSHSSVGSSLPPPSDNRSRTFSRLTLWRRRAVVRPAQTLRLSASHAVPRRLRPLPSRLQPATASG